MTETIRITTLVDNTSNHPTLPSEHGLSILIAKGNDAILFDTGQSNLVQANAGVLGNDLGKVGAIVISHGHYDHTGGLLKVLEGARGANLYLHREALKPKFACRNNKPCRYIGMPSAAVVRLCESDCAHNVVWTEGPTQVYAGLTATGRIPRVTDFEDVGGPFFVDAQGKQADNLWDDQALFYESNEGLVVFLGCAHAGVANTLHYIADLTGQRRMHAVLGGMHLGSASEERISQTIEVLRRYDVQFIGPAHCTGTKATAQLRRAFQDRCLPCAAGTHIKLG